MNPDSRQTIHEPNTLIDPVSSSAAMLPLDVRLATEFDAWNAATDEALSNFEVSLE